jgi:UDP-N-acetylmuramate--alanine ligase
MTNYVHFIGIGGIGMSGIAQILLRQGKRVSGSDIKDSTLLQTLRDLGAQVYIGHSQTHIKDQDLVVYSSAIKEDNPEIKEAKRLNIRTIKRAQALAELAKDETLITITGAHGKTTTASLTSHILLEAGLSPTIVVGGISRNWNNNAYLGEGKYFVIEADESDGSFLYYRPDYSIITNIDYEHIDYYKNFPKLLVAFKEFLNNTKPNGYVFACSDDTNLKNLLIGCNNKAILFGLSKEANIYPENIEISGLSSCFDCFYKGRRLDRFELFLGGMHNISNSLATIALAIELGIDLGVIKKALSTYKGTQRRLQVKSNIDDILLLDDYAHHPTEIKKTLEAVKNLEHNRMIAIFQPHRYTRTKLLLDEFGRSFDLADEVVITDIYPASEQPIEGINGRCIYDKLNMRGHRKANFLPKDEIVEYIIGIAKPKDIIITLGAGDIYKIADELAQKFKR